jgi:hypothetical protein
MYTISFRPLFTYLFIRIHQIKRRFCLVKMTRNNNVNFSFIRISQYGFPSKYFHRHRYWYQVKHVWITPLHKTLHSLFFFSWRTLNKQEKFHEINPFMRGDCSHDYLRLCWGKLLLPWKQTTSVSEKSRLKYIGSHSLTWNELYVRRPIRTHKPTIKIAEERNTVHNVVVVLWVATRNRLLDFGPTSQSNLIRN